MRSGPGTADAFLPAKCFFRLLTVGVLIVSRKGLSASPHPEASRYTSHAFRLGGTQELRDSGSSRQAIADAGVLNSPDFTGYVVFAPDVADGVRQLFIPACDPEEDSSSAEVQRQLLRIPAKTL